MKPILAQLATGQPMSLAQTLDAFELIMTGQATAAQVGALLGMIAVRGASREEILGAARVMRSKATPVAVPAGLTAIDTCGTGGDHAGTFNISTAAALVAAAAGRPRGVVVAKHGNRAVTSGSGSSQVLEALGLKLQVAPQTLTRCLDEAGMCFCFAPAHHPAMKHAVPIRQELGFRTIFNVLGPLTNPAGAARQVIGVFDAGLTDVIAQVLGELGSVHALVVHGQFGNGGIDEISTTGPTRISTLREGRVTTSEFVPQDAGVATAAPEALRVQGVEASAASIRAILAGEKGPHRDIVCLNAAGALVVADLAGDLRAGVVLAGAAIDSGSAQRTLEALVRLTNAV